MLSIVMGVAHDADLRSLSERTLELAKALDLGIRMVHISSTIQSRDESAWAERLVDWVRRRGAAATYQHVIGEPVDQLLRLDVHPETAFMAIGRTLTPSGMAASVRGGHRPPAHERRAPSNPLGFWPPARQRHVRTSNTSHRTDGE